MLWSSTRRKPMTRKRRLIAFIVSAIALLFGSLLVNTNEAYAASGYLDTGRRINYDGFFTTYMTVDGAYAYCANPKDYTPPKGIYTKSELKAISDRTEELRGDIYYGWGSPGFDASLWPSTWVDGTAMTEDRYIALNHILISDTYSSSGNYAMRGCGQIFRTWVQKNVLGFNDDGDVINPNATGRIISDRTHAGGWVPDGFKAFMMYTGAGNQIIVSFYNNGYAAVSKVSEEPNGINGTNGNGNYTLEGAQFGIYSDSGCNSRVTTITTDGSGYAKSSDLTPGTYYMREDYAPHGFWTNSNVYTVQVNSGETTTITIGDTPKKAKIQIEKLSKREEALTLPMYSLEGVEFTVYKKSNNQEITKIVTDASGHATTGDLFLDDYYIKETYVPPSNHYYQNTDTFDVTLNENNAGQTVTINVTNTQKEGSIRVKKSSDGDTADNPNYSFAGIGFELFQLDDNGKILKSVGTFELDENGEGGLDNLLFTNYLLRETHGNAYYTKNTTDYKISLSNTLGIVKNVTDKHRVGRLEIVKTSTDSDTVNNPYYNFEGIEYTVRNKRLNKDVAVLKLDTSGRASIDNLDYDTYEIRETKTNKWYQKNDKVYTVKINADKTIDDTTADANPIVAHLDVEDAPVYVDFQFTKGSADSYLSNQLASVMLSGSTYLLTNTRTPNAKGHNTKIVVDSKGLGKSTKILYDDWQIKEIRAGQGYAVSERVFNLPHTSFEIGKTKNLDLSSDYIVNHEIVTYTKDFDFIKVDTRTGTDTPGATSINNTVFKVNFYDNQKLGDTSGTPSKTWYVETDKQGEVSLEDIKQGKVLATQYGYGSSEGTPVEFISDSPYRKNNENIIPTGTVTVQEVVAPYGYKYDNGTINGPGAIKTVVVQGDPESSDEEIGTFSTTSSDQPIYSKMTLKKVSDRDGKPLSNVVFLITSKTTGEQHVAVTDKNGYISTQVPESGSTINLNDNLLAKNDQGQWYITDESKLTPQCNLWFTGFKDKDITIFDPSTSNGTFPFDDYTIEEIPTSANYGYDMIKSEFTVDYASVSIEYGDAVDETINIHTTATDAETMDHIGKKNANETATINDEVLYDHVTANMPSKMVATLYDVDTGDFIKDSNGNVITSTTEFTPTNRSGSVTVSIKDIDYSLVEGKRVTVYEQLYQNGIQRADHSDSTDENQTVYYPEIHTTATSNDTQGHEGTLTNETVKITDVVDYKALKPGTEYTMTGTLMDKETGKEIIDDNGKSFTTSKTFTPETKDGNISLEFEVPASVLQGKTTVVFEDCLIDQRLIVMHENIDDEEQTVRYPGIHTTATDLFNGSHEGNTTKETIKIDDAVKYENLIKGQTYKLSGTLMNKDTGEKLLDTNGDKIISEVEFVAGEPQRIPASGDGSVTYISGADLSLDDVPVGEITDIENYEIRVSDNAEWTKIAPSTETYKETLSRSDNGTWLFIRTGMSTTDENTASFFTPYILNDEQVRKYVTSNSKSQYYDEEITTNADGRVSSIIHVPFETSTSVLKNKITVVFEDLYKDDEWINTHHNINDENQTVHFPIIGTTALDTTTGLHEGLATETARLTDTVHYKRLTAGQTYTITGTLMNKETNEPLLNENSETITGTATFVPEGETGTLVDGNALVQFETQKENIEGKNTIVFEKLYSGETNEPTNIIANHEDIDDENQEVDYPKVRTSASVDGTRSATTSHTTMLTDTVKYENLQAGRMYRVEGILMNKETSEPLLDENGKQITGSSTFVAINKTGEINVDFTFDSANMLGQSTVVFENLYAINASDDGTDILVGQHADIEDMNQTVRFDIDGLADDLIETGDAKNILPFALIALASCMGAIIVLTRRKHKNI